MFATPLIASIQYCFYEVGLMTSSSEWKSVGLNNFYNALFQNLTFKENLINELLSMLAHVPVIVIFSFFMATMLNRKFPGRTAVRSILFLPVVLTTGVILSLESSDYMIKEMSNLAEESASTMKNMLLTDYLDISSLLSSVGMPSGFITFISTCVDSIYTIVSSSGVQIIIFLAGLQSISPQIYEYASVEGAVGWEAFWKITFPLVKPMILVCSLYTVIDYCGKSTNVVIRQIQGTMMGDGQDISIGLGSAMSWLYLIPILLILGIITLVFARNTFYYD